MSVTEPRVLLRHMFDAAVAAAQPALCLAQHLPAPPKGRTVAIGAGKASAAMARALEDNWPGPLQGLVVTRYGYEVACERIEIMQAAHPVPDAASQQAAVRMRQMVQDLTEDDLVIALISGGGSSLLVEPAAGLSLADKQAVNAALLASGANISEMNTVRRHLSGIKGGRLAAACHPARLVTLLISDVPGDAPQDIASGPTVADTSTCADALDILRRYNIALNQPMRAWLASAQSESLKPQDTRLARAEVRMITAPQIALQAAAEVAARAGLPVHILSDRIEGESRDVGKVLAALAQQVRTQGQPFSKPCVLLSGGETTVTLRGSGQGGRNVEFLLALGVALDGAAGVHALAADTDGVDGAQEIAGAFIGPDSLHRAWALGMNPRSYLDNNDAHSFFQRLGDSVITGPTLTNVNDFRAILLT